MYKNCKVVLLLSDDKPVKGDIIKCTNPSYERKALLNRLNRLIIDDCNSEWTTQHLYIVLDEPIKEYEKDFYIHTSNIPVEQVKQVTKHFNTKGYEFIVEVYGNKNQYNPREIIGKIIASTDSKLNLPILSDGFITEFIHQYNENNFIEDIQVEYFTDVSSTLQCIEVLYNNTIVTKKLKANYTREEVKQLLSLALATGSVYGDTMNSKYAEKWINNNM